MGRCPKDRGVALEFFFGDLLTWDNIFDGHDAVILPCWLGKMRMQTPLPSPQGGEAKTILKPNFDLANRHNHQPTSPKTGKCPSPSLPQIRRFNCSIYNPSLNCRIWGRCPTNRGGLSSPIFPPPFGFTKTQIPQLPQLTL